MKGRVVFRPWGGRASALLDPRAIIVFVLLGLVAFAGVVANVGVGEYPIAPPDVIRALLGLGSDDGNYGFIVNALRLPRALVAVLVGAALAVSGAVLQGITKNDLAAPDIVGVNAGAGLAAVTLIVAFPSVSAAYLPPAAFGGALVVAGLLYLLAWRGSSSPTRLILVGVGLGAVATALTTFMITFGEIYQVSQALVWLTGSVYGRSWEQVLTLLPWLVIFMPLTLLRFRHLNALGLGDEVARGLGVRVELERGLLVLCSVALAAAAVATAGTIAFVGLMAPHIARRLVGPAHGGLLPVSAMTGGAMVVLSDLVGRTLFAPVEIPCGIVTAVVGAPFFLYLLYKTRKA
ncbi:FecCD family ABC transporter permease [Rubrobacter tropicus]|uniref:FecCD family ABC transporter permease n=1 Tax=Rubrobacter tropicus TaxID=2653851 RepID=UPI001D180774|nr:iron ABC transporter permease [Rubrobacter tropicus]